MIPLRLNLLSPRKRKHLKRMALFIYFKNLLEMCLFAVAVAAFLLLGARWFLQDYFNGLTSQLVAVSNQKNDINQRVKHVNTIIKQTEQAGKEYISWMPLIVDITKSVPEAIAVQSMVVDQAEGTGMLTGVAKNRTDLLAFQEALQKLPFVSRVDLPLSQLTAKENIPFIIHVTLKPKE